ncbi:hypothetical protein [Microbacterium trichothecenolyticum]|uniref:Uncharacterized protein n=1 Tax=Microbacterium trichothecenolyticum TaxID=69370 RepID=A0ABU0TZ05_MICTR|nr:hypothetical protein [Microbacterium trichothecenolyticum]MDQ1124886.1 hypothetical protein [Microbacterium trichothecenolyticum]
MDWNSAVVPLVVAAVGAVAVAIGGWMAARSSLRGRLIDMLRDDERERRAFQVRAVSAVNVLGVATGQLIRARLQGLQGIEAGLRAQAAAGASGTVTVNVDADTLSPKEDARVIAATEAWRTVMAEAHVFASDETYTAMRAFDDKRAEVVDAVNAGTQQSDLLTAIVDLEAAQEACDELRERYTHRLYRELQIEKLTGTASVFFLAHAVLLRKRIREADRAHQQGIALVRARIVKDDTMPSA